MTDLVGQKASFEFHLIKILVETEMCVCVGTFKLSNYEVPFSKEPVSQPNIPTQSAPFLKSSSFFKHPEKGKLIFFWVLRFRKNLVKYISGRILDNFLTSP